MNTNKINILGLNINRLNKGQILDKINEFLKSREAHYIVTPNPEIILRALDDEELFYIINQANLSIPDGIGIKFASFFLGEKINRVTGSDLTLDILKLAENKSLKVAILNLQDGLSSNEEIYKCVKNKYSKINLEIFNEKEGNYTMTHISKFKPDILFVATGFPYQEKFIFKNYKKIPNLKLAIGVGGSFDFITKKIKRAPKIMRVLGLEWLWRLSRQPKRIKRIFRAVIVFPYKFIIWRFFMPFFYRPNVVCLLYREIEGKYNIFLVERGDEENHWQLPQGGRDGESLLKAGGRELIEEIGSDKFKFVVIIKNIHKYKFNKKIGKYKTNRHLGYKGQKQGLFIAKFLGKDEDIKINFYDHRAWKWINWVDLDKIVHPHRQEAMKKAKKYFEKEIINKRI